MRYFASRMITAERRRGDLRRLGVQGGREAET
jgi:hypothetical protein